MNLRQRLDEVKRLESGSDRAHYLAMNSVFPALLEVVEQQNRALDEVTRFADELAQADNSGVTPFGFQIIRDARAALSLMDKEL